jgi:integrase
MQVNRQSGKLTVGDVYYTASVFVRHHRTCPDASKAGSWTKCDCRKSVLTYNGATRKQQVISAHTRSWAQATVRAEQWLDQFDPTKREQARQAAQAVTIEQAVGSYLQDKIAQLGDNGTVARLRTLLGDVDAQGTIKRKGKLFTWLDKQIPRPQLISDITAPQLTSWRASWTYGSDQTGAVGFDAVKNFFKFCVGQGWITLSPAASIKRPKIKRGNRTATFSDEQYDAVLAACKGNQRLETFLELLRWSAMSIVDGVLFNRKMLGEDGVLRYSRKKSGSLSTVAMQEHVVVLLRSVEGGEQPFLRKSIGLASAVHEWRRDLQLLFKKAGITQVQTEIGPRRPHPHMLRDTCAVWFLRHGMGIHSVSKMLGHSNVAITSKHYAPWVKELETAHIEEMREVMAAAKPKSSGSVRAIR